MITFQIEEAYQSQIDTGRLQKAVSDTLFHQQFQPTVDIAIVIGDDEHIQSLNKTYRGIDEPTDVLAFPHGGIDPDTGRENLGDIIIAYPQAAQQAETGGHPVMDELVLLVVHATLHLLGYEHETDQQKRIMWSVQDDILDKLGISARPHD
jgi:probable rRNA maturation factor